uniref:Uncharacterized protein n=1 Tax=Arundo donax TaxID=35708 RepID=A0A0A9ETZ1_ARUDO
MRCSVLTFLSPFIVTWRLDLKQGLALLTTVSSFLFIGGWLLAFPLPMLWRLVALLYLGKSK